ncbi:MAG: hypothetical protein F4Z31_15670 [Gemmatimonadetes bacterium]|nr:hypothetical protein [Gemmatimonadota bacterium]MYA43170.1 hypothetical protein [Gemmatimonadota bacterium]MYE95268.1 hypothetical protein [Gemmatimonadota bacterium]MYJ10443.1 hypothetical protein [Gemmatimonadota bacterium]
MRSKEDTLRRPLFAALLALTVACAAPESGADGEGAGAEPMAAEVQEMPPAPMADPADVESVEAIVTAVYESISGNAGVPRDWDRFRSLFLPGARLMPVATEHLENGRRSSISSVSPEEFAAGSEGFFEEQGFFEVEIGNVTETYGDIAHRFSSYASMRTDDPNEEPFNRGINSFQLLHDGERWWILTIFWQHEPDAGPIPDKYLDS